MQHVLDFLEQIRDNNHREWFEAHKAEYEQVKTTVHHLCTELLSALIPIHPGLEGLQNRDCMFRLHRDVRFSKDKSPYKTHWGIVFAQGGKNSERPCLYIHLEKGASFLAAGCYYPPAEVLKNIRQEIDYNGEHLLKILENPDFIQSFAQLEGEQLKTVPKGYDKEHPMRDLLRRKSFIVSHPLQDSEVCGKDFVEKVIRLYRQVKPFNDWLNMAFE